MLRRTTKRRVLHNARDGGIGKAPQTESDSNEQD